MVAGSIYPVLLKRWLVKIGSSWPVILLHEKEEIHAQLILNFAGGGEVRRP